MLYPPRNPTPRAKHQCRSIQTQASEKNREQNTKYKKKKQNHRSTFICCTHPSSPRRRVSRMHKNKNKSKNKH